TTTERRVTAATSDAGLFLLPSLRPGPYRLEVEAAGFRSFRRDGLEIRTGERVRVDVALAIGTFAESAVVTVDVPLIKTERSDVGGGVPTREAPHPPVNGRGYLSPLPLAPGAPPPPGTTPPRLNGGRPRVNEYIYDGISVLQPEPGTVPYFPTIDDIQE